MAMADSSDIYHPEWLALEQLLGSRPQIVADPSIDKPMFEALGAQLAEQWPKLESELVTSEESIPATAHTPSFQIRIYKPAVDPGNLPLILYFHGGGYISGNLTTEEPHCQILACRVPAIVINVDYPLAPEHNLNTILACGLHSISYATTHVPPWTSSNKVLVAGGSAGASLAIQLAYHFAATPGRQSTLSGCVALFPFCGPVGGYHGPFKEQHTSYHDKATTAPILTTKAMKTIVTLTNSDYANPNHYALSGTDEVLHEFPATYIVTAEHDPCRDDGRVLALRLQSDQSHRDRVKEDHWLGLGHYFHLFPTLKVTNEAMVAAIDGVKWVVRGGGDGSGITVHGIQA